ncbi:MAG: right-handed parallel beta-helix repeat-containing protein [Bacteroidia bacterium]
MYSNRITIFAALFILLVVPGVQAKNYYLSGSGNNQNKGNSPETSWISIDRLNQQKLVAGDSVLFKRGERFTGEIAVNESGTTMKPIVYGAFGAGKCPVISGAIEIKHWETAEKGILVASISNKVNNLFCNNKQQILARYPNQGYLKIDGGLNSKVSFFDADLTQKNEYWKDANVRFKAYEWEWRTSKVSNFANHQVTIADSSSTQLNAGWGYYFDNKLEELDSIGEWFYDEKDQKLYYLPDPKNDSDAALEASIYENGIVVQKDIQNIEIRDLTIKMYHNCGIFVQGNNQNIRITGNFVTNISLTAVLFGKNSNACTIENNQIADNNGRGIFAIEPQFMKIRNNRVSRIGFVPGYGISGVNGMVGIGIGNTEEFKNKDTSIANNNLISFNKVDSIGYGGIRMDGSNSILENNEVSRVMYFLSDGAAIYCWATGKNYTHDNIIRNNIIHDVFGNREATPSAQGIIANGIYIDNNCYRIKVEGNVIYNLSGSGVHVNSEAVDNEVLNNTIYNCGTGLSIAEWSKPNSTFGNNISGNIVFCKTPDQSAVELMNWLLPYTNSMGTLSGNTYYNFFEKYFFKESYLSANKEEKVSIKYTFEGWQSKLGYDKDGKAYQLKSELAGFSNSRIYVNNEPVSLSIRMDSFDSYNLQGKKIDSLEIQPFGSQIVLYR